jgi:hypothetical protein
MYFNRDEFLLLSYSGRGLHSTRAGPRPFGLPEFDSEVWAPRRASRRAGRAGLRLRRGARGGLRHGLGWRIRRPVSPPRRHAYPGEEYFELEFAVGFPAEEESLQ